MSYETDPDFIDPIYSQYGSRTDVLKDKSTGMRKIVVTKPKDPLFKHLKDHRHSCGRMTGIGMVNQVDRMGGVKIAELDPLQLIQHPEWQEEGGDGTELLRFLDAHPEQKTIPVGWTRQQLKREIITDKFRENFKEVKSGGQTKT